jgi:hypothetical protein
LFVSKKILPAHPGKSTPIYIGDVVAVLHEAGEAVKTASSCSGNGNVNGYIDISPNQISVWSYADGHTIWSYQDIRGLFNGT